jgi:hypothetical protein
MKSIDRQSLEEQTRLVSRYVAGDLSRSERAEFEAWLIASPELATEVEMERRLRRGIASAARRGWLKRGGAPARQFAPERRWRMAAAASVVLSVMALSAVMMSPERGSRAPGSVARNSARPLPALTVRLGSVRGMDTSPDVVVMRDRAPSELLIEPDVVTLTCADGTLDFECAGGAAPSVPQYAEYEMDLVNRRGSTLAWRSARQLPSGGNRLSFVVPTPGTLAAGDYDMVVRGHSPDHEEVIARFWLRVAE